MQAKDIIESLAKEASLIVRSSTTVKNPRRPDGRLLRFRGCANGLFTFVVNGTNIVGYRSSDANTQSAKFDLCNPGSLKRILAFMNDD